MGRSRSSSIQQMRRWAMISAVVVAQFVGPAALGFRWLIVQPYFPIRLTTSGSSPHGERTGLRF